MMLGRQPLDVVPVPQNAFQRRLGRSRVAAQEFSERVLNQRSSGRRHRLLAPVLLDLRIQLIGNGNAQAPHVVQLTPLAPLRRRVWALWLVLFAVQALLFVTAYRRRYTE